MLKPGIYRHFKGTLYRVLGTGKHSETEEDMVFYQAVGSDQNWIRPLQMFTETVPSGAPRFEWFSDDITDIQLSSFDEINSGDQFIDVMYRQFLQQMSTDLGGRIMFGYLMFKPSRLKEIVRKLINQHGTLTRVSSDVTRNVRMLVDNFLQLANRHGMIDELREEEGNTVTLLCPNPEGSPAQAVLCDGEWTNWEPRRFHGETVEECLVKALHEYRSYVIEYRPTKI